MRLTLRTLLAWLDGVLPPEEQRQLGEKVEASPVARELVDRIRAVVDNPHLQAPRVDAKGLGGAADTVAEYLDNTLSPERLEAFERICLESDMHLAEVAACHTMLAELAKHPDILPPLDDAHRRRLLEALHHRVAAPPRAAGGERGARLESRPVPEVLPPATPAPSAGRTRRPWAAWAMAVSALSLLGVLTALLAQSTGMFRSRGDAPARAVEKAAAAVPARSNDAPEEPIPAGERAPAANANGENSAPPIAADVEAGAPSRPETRERMEGDAGGLAAVADRGVAGESDAVPPSAEVAREQPLEAGGPVAAANSPPGNDRRGADGQKGAGNDVPGPRKVPAGGALAIASGVRSARPGPTIKTPETPGDDGNVAGDVGLEAAGEPDAAGLGFVAADGLLLRRGRDGDRVSWGAIGVGATLAAEETLVVPPGLHPELNLGGVSVRLLPRSTVALSADADGTPRIDLETGRLVARSARPDGRLTIVLGGEGTTVTAGLDGAVAAEAAWGWRPGLGQEAVPKRWLLVAVSKPIHLVFPTGVPEVLTQVDAPARGGRLVETGGQGEAIQLERLPAWMTGAERIESLERNAVEAFAGRLAALPPGSDPATGLEEVLLGLAIDRRVENRLFAAATFALLGNPDVAVEALCAEGPGRKLEARQWEALEAVTVPAALSGGEESTARLRKAFEERGPAGRVELLMAMARGPSDAELAAGDDRKLVEALADPSLVVRRYALRSLVDIVEPSAFDRSRFRPDGPPESRRDGMGWWRSLLEKGRIRRGR
jgi:hypothetical protein